MGNLKIGDNIIITEALKIFPFPKIVGEIAMIVHVDDPPYPYKIIFAKENYWVDGIPYSSLVKELF